MYVCHMMRSTHSQHSFALALFIQQNLDVDKQFKIFACEMVTILLLYAARH